VPQGSSGNLLERGQGGYRQTKQPSSCTNPSVEHCKKETKGKGKIGSVPTRERYAGEAGTTTKGTRKGSVGKGGGVLKGWGGDKWAGLHENRNKKGEKMLAKKMLKGCMRLQHGLKGNAASQAGDWKTYPGI